MTYSAQRLADLALPYFDDITDENDLNEYIEYLPHVDDWTKEDHLTQAIGDDTHDLLKNGNDEDLNWSEADVDELRDEDYYSRLDHIARLLAQAVLRRIYN